MRYKQGENAAIAVRYCWHSELRPIDFPKPRDGRRRRRRHAVVHDRELRQARLAQGLQPARRRRRPARALGEGPEGPQVGRRPGRRHDLRLVHPQGGRRACGARVPRRGGPGGGQAREDHLKDREGARQCSHSPSRDGTQPGKMDSKVDRSHHRHADAAGC